MLKEYIELRYLASKLRELKEVKEVSLSSLRLFIRAVFMTASLHGINI